MDRDRVMQLVEMLKQSTAGELEVKEGDRRVKLSQRAKAKPAPVAKETAVPANNVEAAPREEADSVPANAAVVKAHMVGLFHRGNGPGAAPIVSIGDKVNAGDVIGTIEALRNFTEVVCPVDGEVVAIVAEDGGAVQFGDPLIAIQPG